MTLSLAYLGPQGTYTEMAATIYSQWLQRHTGEAATLQPCSSIVQALKAAAEGRAGLAIVPVENSIEGSVTVTLDTLWQLDALKIQHALVLPIVHVLISQAQSTAAIKTVYSHPQALAQCQQWIEQQLPQAVLIPTSSTTEALHRLPQDSAAAAISSERAAELYKLPTLARSINDYADNCTKFWALGLTSVLPDQAGDHTALAFSLPVNAPGALLKPLQIFAEHSINLSRIESRPTKRSLGDYLFFVDLEAGITTEAAQAALGELLTCTEQLRVLGSYRVLPVPASLS